jgi:hypothetical protein
MMTDQAVSRKASVAVSQPPVSASPHAANGRSATVTIRPAMNAVTARRMAGACQPSHRWYKVGAGTPVIV